MVPQYVVVKKQSPFTFSHFHSTEQEAEKEAERLARKERLPYLVLMVVAEVRPVEIPIAWERVEGLAADRDD